jgi:hypothetical protein
LKRYREFVRDRLDFNEDKYEAIDAIFNEFYDIISREHHMMLQLKAAFFTIVGIAYIPVGL